MSGRTAKGHLVAAEQIACARRNVSRFPWAAAERDEAVVRARRWIGLDDEALWGLVTAQTIGRSTNASVAKGCPSCGNGIDRHGGLFEVDVLADPWKIRCPNCGGRFPTNDFGAFYRGGIGPDGCFDPARADRGLLYNAGHPDPNDPLHGFGVDDGTGWTDAAGESFKLVGVYGHYGIWGEVAAACRSLRAAFILTGEPAYAHKAGLLLARIGDVYPAMDWSHWAKRGFFNSDGLTGRGRIWGRIWEPSLLMAFAECYDAVCGAWRDRDPLFAFLAERQRRYGLTMQDSPRALCRHFEDHVLREGIQAIVNGDVHRNEPGDQVTMATLAVVLDAGDTDGRLDWIFREGFLGGRTPDGGHLPQLFADEIDRDGVGSEAAPSYSLGWLYKPQGMNNLARALSARPSYTRHRIGAYARYRRMFLAPVRMLCLGRYTPPIGDTGKTGEPDLCGLTVAQCLEGFEDFGDPVLAQAAYHLAGGDPTRIRGAIFDADPEAIRERVMQVTRENGILRLPSDVMTGYGLALLRDGNGETERTLWIYYGRNTGHGHADRLNLGLYGFGLDLLPDQGYPEHARVWPTRSGWTNHTISHNTVLVDRRCQRGSYSGRMEYAGFTKSAQVFGVSSPDVYPQCSAYGRSSALIRVSGDMFYAVDLFRVSGGSSHHYSFHAAEGEITTEGMDLKPQGKGTYAGEGVASGEFYDGEVRNYTGSGFQYLYDVRRCPDPDRVVSVDWRIRDTWKVFPESQVAGQPTLTDIHLRWSLFRAPGEVALCHGDPPQNKPGNPRRLTYVVAAHEGDGPLDSGFLSLIEGYQGERVLQHAEEIEIADGGGDGCRAIRVCLPEGRIDTVVFGDGRTRLRVDGRIGFDGVFGLWVEVHGRPAWAMLVGGTILGTKARAIRRGPGVWSGIVSAREAGKIWTETPPPDDGPLTGSSISIRNDNERDACYPISGVIRRGGMTGIEVGDVDFVRGMVDNLDYGKGFRYDFEPGQTFRVLRTWFERWDV